MRNMNKFLIIFICIVGISSLVLADIPAAFVDIGYGARPMGMGGAYTAMSDDVNSVFWNPAGLTLMRDNQLTVMYTKQYGLIPYGLGAYSHRFGFHNVAAGFITSGNDVLRETTFITSYAAVYKLPLLGNTGVGMNVRYRHSSFGNNEDGGENRIQGSADGAGMDLGFMWQIHKRTRIGIFARDILNSMTYNNNTLGTSYSESVPAGLIMGIAHRINTQSTVSIDWEKALYDDVNDKLHLGTEVTLFKVIMCRGGMWQNMDAVENRNYSLGMGLNVATRTMGIQFDFAYLFNDFAHTPRISLSLTH